MCSKNTRRHNTTKEEKKKKDNKRKEEMKKKKKYSLTHAHYRILAICREIVSKKIKNKGKRKINKNVNNTLHSLSTLDTHRRHKYCSRLPFYRSLACSTQTQTAMRSYVAVAVQLCKENAVARLAWLVKVSQMKPNNTKALISATWFAAIAKTIFIAP